MSQDEAKNIGDAGHRRGFLTKYWLKNFRQKLGSYSLTVTKLKTAVMADIIVRIRPENAIAYPNFSALIGSMSIEVRELNTPFSSTTIGTTTTIVPHIIGVNPKSIATALVGIPASAITGGKTNVRITIKIGGTVYADVACHNLTVYNIGTPPTNTYQTLNESIIIAVPATAPSPAIVPVNLMDLPANGNAPNYDLLDASVSTAASALGYNIASLSYAKCETIAQNILLPNLVSPLPPVPQGTTLEDIYTATGNLSEQTNYEGQLTQASNQGAAITQLADYIYALSAAYHCTNDVNDKAQIVLDIPVRPKANSNSAICQGVEVALEDTSGMISIPKEAFYALGANLSNTTTPAQRCLLAFGQSAATIISTLENADTSGVINLSSLTFNQYQIARRLNALRSPSNGTPICTMGTNETALVNAWLADSQSDINNFWLGITGIEEMGHKDIILCAITYDFLSNIDAAALASLSASSTEDLNTLTQAAWEALLLACTDATTKMLFLMQIKRYFEVAGSTTGPSGPNDPTIPAYEGTGEDPITIFINCYHDLDPNVDKDDFFNASLNHDLVQDALKCTFPDDVCAQEWLEKRINNLIELNDLVSNCEKQAITDYKLTKKDGSEDIEGKNQLIKSWQFSVIETLYSIGFTNKAAITECSLSAFKNALQGTEAYECAEIIYNNANKASFEAMKKSIRKKAKSTKGLKKAFEILEKNGFNNANLILAQTYPEFQKKLAETAIKDLAEVIYQGVGGIITNAVAAASNNFKPINTNGQLVNCIPPKYLAPLSPAAYLKDLLKISSFSHCDEPFPDDTDGVFIKDIISNRRGDFNKLEISHSNTYTPIPYIDLANESLEHMVFNDSNIGTIQNNAIKNLNNIPLLQNGTIEQPKDAEEYHHPPQDLFGAIPEHSSISKTILTGFAYEKLVNDFSAPNLPYSQPVDILQTYLGCLGTNRYEIMRKFRKSIHEFVLDPTLVKFDSSADEPFRSHLLRYPVSHDIALAYLGITKNEYSALYSNETDFKFPFTIFGFQNEQIEINKTIFKEERYWINYTKFLNQVGLDNCTFSELYDAISGWNILNFQVIKADGTPGEIAEKQFCFSNQWILQFQKQKDNETIVKTILFIRLWQKVKTCFSFYQLRDICENFELFHQDSHELDSNLIRKLVAFKMLHKEFGLPLTNGTDVSEQVGVNRTHLFALWKDQSWIDNSDENKALWEWAIQAFLEKIQDYAIQHYQSDFRPDGFTELLKENLNPLSILVGFDNSLVGQQWNFCPTHTIRFAEFIAKFYASDFTFGEMMWLFTNQHIGGDDPFQLQSPSEALCFPLEIPDNEPEFSLAALRDKLCNIEITEAEVGEWAWQKIEATFQNEFCLDATDTSLQTLAEKFFPNILANCGCPVDVMKRKFSHTVTSNAALWNTTNPQSPFQYDSGNGALWYELPLDVSELYTKLSRIRLLEPEEAQAVRDLTYQPLVLLAGFSYLFPNFSEVWAHLINEQNQEKRFAYFQKQFALFYKRSQYIVEFAANATAAITCVEKEDGKKIAWTLLKHLYADENFPVPPNIWEDKDGQAPPVTWENKLTGGAFNALQGVTGTGLLCEYYDLQDDKLLWRDIAYQTNFFGIVQNQWNAPIPAIIPNLALEYFFPPLAGRNGFGFESTTATPLGGFQGFRVKCQGVLWIEEGGKYTFMAGSPSPDGEAPIYKEDLPQQWRIAIKKEQKEWELLSHNWEDMVSPPNKTAPIKLKPGAYDICIEFIQPSPNFLSQSDICPQTTGLQIKYTGTDTKDKIITIPFKKLFISKKDKTLAQINQAGDEIADIDGAALNYLQDYYPVTINDCRNTFQRLMKAMIYAYRFNWSGIGNADDGMCEIEFLLKESACFKGFSYNWNGSIFEEHEVIFDFNLLPVQDTYCPKSETIGMRDNPSVARQRALADLWESMFDYAQIKEKANKIPELPAWRALKEIVENHPDGAIHLLRHLGIDLSISNKLNTFYDGFNLEESHLKKIEWLLRVCHNADCLEKFKCNIPMDDSIIDSLDFANLAANEEDLGRGLVGLTRVISKGLIANEPRRYKILNQLNDGIRERCRQALIAYLTAMDRTTLNGKPVTNAGELSELLLLDIEAGICQKASRLEEAISAIQLFVHRAKLGLESTFSTSAAFNHFWDRQMASYQIWKKCKKRTLYPENWIEFEKLEEARKSKGFLQLEDKLRENTLSIPISGGLTTLESSKPPAHSPLAVLQKREVAQMALLTPKLQGFDLLATPDKQATASWLASIENNQLPFWLDAASKLGLPFVKITAASLPPASITYECDYDSCCTDCGKQHPPKPDEYFFWLMDAKYYNTISQDANQAWDDISQLPALLHMDSEPIVYLAWSRLHNGELQPMRWSSEGIKDASNPELIFLGRAGDSLNFQVKDAGLPNDVGFRYDIPTDEAIALPTIGQSYGVPVPSFGFNAYPYFIYFEPCAPITPKSLYSPALLIAEKLKIDCQFENAIKWLELELKPLDRCNTWISEGASEKDICQQSLLFHYLQTLYDWGKALMQQNTGESLQKANLIFKTAKKILGETPKTIQDNIAYGTPRIEDFYPLRPSLNPQLSCLYEQVDDACELINECINSWRLPNCDMAPSFWGTDNTHCKTKAPDCFNETNWCLTESPYRFQFLHAKALEYTNALSGLGGALLAAYEKRDAETLAAIRERQGRQLLERNLEIRQNQYRAADWDVQALNMSLIMANIRLSYYQNLIANGLIQKEEDYEDFTDQSMIFNGTAQTIEGTAAVFNNIPDPYVGFLNFLGMPGGKKTAKFIEAGATIARIAGYIQGTRAGKRLTQAGWVRRLQEWVHQVNLITVEIEQITRQLRASERRKDIAYRELNNHQLQMTHAIETHDFLRDKFTNEGLYQWLQKETAALYRQMYELTMRVAHQAQKAYNFELEFSNDNYLNIPFWDNLHNGLLAGERLQLALRQMNKAYCDRNVRDYELTKHISLAQHAPREFLQLKTTGRCIIQLPEWLFDLDNPGHYLRRIRSMSITIPCVVGPYTSVNCKVTLVSSKVRFKQTLNKGNTACCDEEQKVSLYKAKPEDNRFIYRYNAKQAMATSTANNDSGMRELNFRDERYLLFECEGAISTWCIELPEENNYFDINSVSDVIMHLNYCALEGGSKLAQAAQQEAQKHLPGNGWKLFDVSNEFPDEWYQFQGCPDDSQSSKELMLKLGRRHFPFIPGKHQLSINRLELFFETCEELDCNNFEIGLLLNPKDRAEHPDKCEIVPIRCVKRGDFGCLYHGVINLENILIPVKGVEEVAVLMFPEELSCLEQVYWLTGYEVEPREKCKLKANT